MKSSYSIWRYHLSCGKHGDCSLWELTGNARGPRCNRGYHRCVGNGECRCSLAPNDASCDNAVVPEDVHDSSSNIIYDHDHS